MAKFKLRGPDGGTYAITADTPEAAHAALYGSQAEAAPKLDAPVASPEEQTNKLSTTEKFAKGAISGTIGGAENIISLLDKAGIGDKDKLQVARDLASGARGMFGVTPQEYKPAGDTAWDSNKPFLERAKEAPRAMVEAAAPMALASLGGPVAAGLAVGATQAAPTIDRVRAADNTDPNAELTLGQKARVAGDLGVQMALGGLGSKLTFGASPVKAVGLEGVKGAAKQLGATVAADAAIGGAGVAADKAIVEGESPTLSDIGVGGIAGGAGGLFGGAKRAGKEAIVSTRFRELGRLDPQSRGEVADRLQTFENSFGATRKSLLDDVTEASKGADGVTKKYINDAKIAFEEGQRVKPEWIEAVTQVDPEAGRALRNLDTFGVMRNYDKESFSTDAAKINPLSNWQVRWGDITLAHLLGPKAALIAAGLQGAGVAAAKGMDRLTGLSDPAKVITEKFAGSADPRPTLAEARASRYAARQQDNDAYFALKKGIADRNLSKAESDRDLVKKKAEFQKAAAADAKARKAKEKRMMQEAAASVRARNWRDDLQENYEAGVKRDESNLLKQQRNLLAIRERSDIPMSEALGRDLGDNQNVPLQELVSSDARPSLKTALGVQRLVSQAEKAYWDEQRQHLAIRNNSDVPLSEAMGRNLGDSQNVPLQELVSSNAAPNIKTALAVQRMAETPTATSAALPLAVAKLKARLEAQEEGAISEPPPAPTYNPNAMEWGPSSSLNGTPTARAMTAARALARHNAKIEKKDAPVKEKAQKAKADAELAKAELVVSEARKESRNANKDADPKYITFSKHGVTERYRRDEVKNAGRFEDSWNERQDERKFFLDEAKGFLTSKKDEKTLAGMLQRWSKVRNNPDKAKELWDDFVEKSSASDVTKGNLKDAFEDIRWTWETVSGS